MNGITVAQVEPEQVTLAQGGDQEVVPLLVTKGAPPAAPPPCLPRRSPQGRSRTVAGAAVARRRKSRCAPAGRAAPRRRPAGSRNSRRSIPNTLFGPRPGGLTPGNSYIADPGSDDRHAADQPGRAAHARGAPRAPPRAPQPTIAMSEAP